MNRIVKAAQPLLLVAVLFVAGALFGARFTTGNFEMSKKASPMMVVPVEDPKPCTYC
jgi:hypothetical protein